MSEREGPNDISLGDGDFRAELSIRRESQKRIAELEAENLTLQNRLVGAIHLLPATITCGELRSRADTVGEMRERAEKAELKSDLLQAALTTLEEQLEGMSNHFTEAVAQRDAALDVSRRYGRHKDKCRWMRLRSPCDCGWDEKRKAVLPDD